jgi:hypothetical protein
MHAPDARTETAPKRTPSWLALVGGLFVLNFATGALSGKHPSDLYWIASPVAQVGIMAALVLAVVVPAFSFLRSFFERLSELNRLSVGRAIVAHLGLGVVATAGSFIGGALTGDPPVSGLQELAIKFPVGAITSGLIFLLTVRLFFHRVQRMAGGQQPNRATANPPGARKAPHKSPTAERPISYPDSDASA